MTAVDQNCQRRLKRHKVDGVVEVFDASTDKCLGRLVNIHREGLMLMGNVLLSSDKIYRLQLRLPALINGASSISLGVDCLWTREAGSDSQHWAGCRIVDASDEVLQMIDALVQTFAEH